MGDEDGVSKSLDREALGVRSLQNISLGNVAVMSPQIQLPKKYRTPKTGEISTYQGAGVVPVTRLPNGEVRVLLYQPQRGKKQGVRWYDFGGTKRDKSEFTSSCACRKFAKQTYGLFGCQVQISGQSDEVDAHLKELYQGLSNLPLMLKASQDWAQMQLLESDAKLFYNDQREYHIYVMTVPYVPAEILGKVSEIVDGGKRVFQWLAPEDFLNEALAPRLHTDAFNNQIAYLQDDAMVDSKFSSYGDPAIRAATGCFSAEVVSTL